MKPSIIELTILFRYTVYELETQCTRSWPDLRPDQTARTELQVELCVGVGGVHALLPRFGGWLPAFTD
jgi:hypothetical protein